MAKAIRSLAFGAPGTLALAVLGMFALPLSAQEMKTRTIVQAPTGWFGVRLSDQVTLDGRGNAFFDSYPVITQVEPNSPASKAGVQPGDVLLTFNAHDMRGGSVQLIKWLKVGSPFVLRVRRNDKTRVVKGVLGTRPKNWDQNLVMQLTVPENFERESGSVGVGLVGTRMPTPRPMVLLPPALGMGGGVYPFAGAEFTALNADLCEALGVKPEGVFVTSVSEGSPARIAGLRGGDVVIKADAFKIDNPIDLVRAIKNADDTDQEVVLEVLRKNKLQTVALHW